MKLTARTAVTHTGISRLHLGCISAASRLHLGYISAASRISARPRLGVRSKRLAEARESEAEPAELPRSQLCTPARGFGRQRRADPPGAVLRQSGGEGGGDADELGRGCGGEERAAAWQG